jgi:hypothetical protein
VTRAHPGATGSGHGAGSGEGPAGSGSGTVRAHIGFAWGLGAHDAFAILPRSLLGVVVRLKHLLPCARRGPREHTAVGQGRDRVSRDSGHVDRRDRHVRAAKNRSRTRQPPRDEPPQIVRLRPHRTRGGQVKDAPEPAFWPAELAGRLLTEATGQGPFAFFDAGSSEQLRGERVDERLKDHRFGER